MAGRSSLGQGVRVSKPLPTVSQMLRRSSAAKRNALARKPQRTAAQVAKLRLGLVGGLIAVLFLAMFARLYSLQVLRSTGYTKLATANQVRAVSVQPPRGNVLVRSGTVIAGSNITEAVTLSQYVARQNPGVIGRLATVLHLTKADVNDALQDNQFSQYVPVPIATDVSKAIIVYIAEHQSEFPGVSAQAISERTYPEGDTAAQVLGYLGPVNSTELGEPQYKSYPAGDLVGQSGVEESYNNYLYGKPGTTDLSVNSSGQVVGTVATTAPTPGDSVQLNLDLGLQQTLEKALSAQILKVRGTYVPQTGTDAAAPGGAALVLDPETGAILAMASYPTYSPSEWVGGISDAEYGALTDPSNNEPLLNRAIQGVYTPGSTFKLATATAALNTGLINPSYYYDDATGVYTAPNCTGKCTFTDDDSDAQGELDVSNALTVSDDAFFYNIGDLFYTDYENNGEYGFTPIQKTANAYGLGEGTGVDLPGEQTGQVDSLAVDQADCAEYPKDYSCPAAWYAGSNIEMAFGQGATEVTPIELADAYATFANGGTKYQPEVAADVVNAQGKVVKTFAPVVTGHVRMSTANHDAMLQGFIGAVQDRTGTAYPAFEGFDFSKLDVAGKTGTATTNHPVPDSLFVAFAGADIDDPQYVVAVVIEQAGYGATDAAPVAVTALQYLENHPPGPITPPKPSAVLVPELSPEPTSPTTTTTVPGSTTSTTSGAGYYLPTTTYQSYPQTTYPIATTYPTTTYPVTTVPVTTGPVTTGPTTAGTQPSTATTGATTATTSPAPPTTAAGESTIPTAPTTLPPASSTPPTAVTSVTQPTSPTVPTTNVGAG